MRTLKHSLIITAALALGAGCTAPSSIGEDSQAIALSSLPPNLPDCQSVDVSHRVTVRHIDGVDDLYVAYDGATPICIDSGEFIIGHFTAGVGTDPGDSNPMPGIASSVSSNPMPGTDPASSNPMPGHPDYGQQGYTTGH